MLRYEVTLYEVVEGQKITFSGILPRCYHFSKRDIKRVECGMLKMPVWKEQGAESLPLLIYYSGQLNEGERQLVKVMGYFTQW